MRAEETLVVWRRLGKEHGEETGFRVNPPEVVEAHLREKTLRFRLCILRSVFCISRCAI